MIDSTILADSNSGAACKWNEVGDVRKVIVATATKKQATDMDGRPAFWDDGQHKEQVVIAGVDPDTGDDCTMYLKWWGGTKRAFVVAMAGKSLEVGGTFAMQWTGEEPSKTKGFNPAKTWTAQYAPPANVALASNDLI